MKNEKNIETFRQWIKQHQAHNIDGMLDFLTDDVNIRSAAGGKMPPATNKSEAAHHWATIYETFADFHMEEIRVTSEDDVLFAEIAHGGTMNAPMGDMPATGASYKVKGAFRFEFEEGNIKSILSYWDTASMLMQLGLVPGPALQD
jgi:steroid delta-isomerase-like uncharacterized protein